MVKISHVLHLGTYLPGHRFRSAVGGSVSVGQVVGVSFFWVS